MIEAYPLQWPTGWPRVLAGARRRAHFGRVRTPEGSTCSRKTDLSVNDGLERILGELGRLGVTREDVVISTNLRVRLDGLPRSDQATPKDPGVAVYWNDQAVLLPRCMAVDLYDRVADNLGAVAATIEAMRAIERHGGAQILARAFTGFTALPAPMVTRAWWQVLGLNPDEKEEATLEAAYKTLRSKHHPDHGGDNDEFIAVRRAYDQGRAAMGLS